MALVTGISGRMTPGAWEPGAVGQWVYLTTQAALTVAVAQAQAQPARTFTAATATAATFRGLIVRLVTFAAQTAVHTTAPTRVLGAVRQAPVVVAASLVKRVTHPLAVAVTALVGWFTDFFETTPSEVQVVDIAAVHVVVTDEPL